MASFDSLPDEILTIIFKRISYTDVMKFGSTCKRYNEMVKSNQWLWKDYCKKLTHPDILQYQTDCTDWFVVFRKYMKLKRKIEKYLDEMSSVQYNNYDEVDVNDCQHFFRLALADESSLGESIYILRQFIRKGNGYLNNNCIEKPFCLTAVYYAKIVIRYLFQMYLVFIWGKKHVHHKQSPVNVINFFVQWADPLIIHPESEVVANLETLINLVKKEISKQHPSKVTSDPNIKDPQTLLLLTDDEVIQAISSVIYKQNYIKLTRYTTLSTLDIVQVIQNRSGCMIAMAAIYQYLAEHFGLHCNLIVFPNHFILELNKKNDNAQVYKIALDTGECKPKGRCPFSQSFLPNNRYTYCPISLIRYICAEFLSTAGRVRDCYTVNVISLLEMVNHGEFPFIYLLQHLEDQGITELQYNINYFKMQPDQLSLLRTFCIDENPRPPRKRGVTVKTRSPDLKYAVGMICHHKQYHYVCLIIDWDSTCFDTEFNQSEIMTLQFGIKQPFYHVIAMDQSKRYVPQENLVEYNRPSRLYHLEDAIARSFSHFNGFAYVPNEEKSKEYPEDTAVSNFFKSQYELRNRQ